ncbi:MAG: patatin-like phospholipase family protein [Actinomycetota bacterium]|nr:patatin-like phospholipase family protein [Actinomycetota bacterium]MDH5312855.1 patatin-like phospholipase family protein [Actinomycetota bacterium]
MGSESHRDDSHPKRERRWRTYALRVGSSPITGVVAFVGLLASLALLFAIVTIDLPRRGLLDLTFAGDAGTARLLVDRIGRSGMRDDVRRAILLDTGLIVAYLVGGAAACLWGGERLLGGRLEVRLGAIAALGTAAILDAVENAGLWKMLQADFEPWSLVTAAVAWPKFFILGAVLPYALVAFAFRAWTTAGAAELKRRGAKQRRWSPSLIAQTPPSAIADLGDPPEIGSIPSWRERDWVPTPGRVGICCSGGGIRSASFNLGALQALTEHSVVRRARYISAVSGGSYIASALVAIQRETARGGRGSFYEQGRGAFEPGTPEVAYLRRNTSYIAPSGMSKLLLVIRLLGGLAINVVFGLLALFIVTRPLGWMLRIPTVHGEFFCGPDNVRTVALECGEIGRLHVTAALWLAVLWPVTLGAVIGLAAIGRRWTSLFRFRVTIGVAAVLAMLSIVMFTTLILLPWVGINVPKAVRALFEWLPRLKSPGEATPNYVWLANLLGVGALGAAVARIVTRRSAKIAMAVAAVLFPLTLIVTGGLMVVAAARSGVRGPLVLNGQDLWPQWVWWLLAMALFAIVYAWGDQTAWSMHPFYKRRLSVAFAVRRTASGVDQVPYDVLQALSRYDSHAGCTQPEHACDDSRPHRCTDLGCPHECRAMPEIVICAAANVTELGGAPTGRAALPFTFGPREIGGREVGWIQTRDMEASLVRQRARDITLPASVAISGAAVSPAMGKMSRPAVRALLTLTNARLGVWLPNPRYVSQLRAVDDELPGTEPLRFRDRARANYLAKEAFGMHRKGDRFLYVTDGGHVENLGLVELLRRGCTEIYCFDASGDQVDTFFTLGEAVAIARSELGVEIRLDPTALRATADEQPVRGQPWSTTDVEVGSFEYPPDANMRRMPGRIIYTKAVVTPDATWDVKAYGEKDETFPTLGTANQLFTEERFDAYRELGFDAGDHAFRRAAGEPPP